MLQLEGSLEDNKVFNVGHKEVINDGKEECQT